MDPMTIMAIGSGVASLANGVLGHFGQRSANAQTLSNMREQNRFQERLWNMTNEHNDPSAQRERYERAGINPYMALGNITPGIAQSGSSVSPVGAENELSPLGQGIAGAGNQIVNAYLQNQLISSQVEKNLAEADATRTDTPYIGRRNESNIANTEANTSRTHAQTKLDRVNTLVATASLDRLKQMTPIELQLMQANAESVTANTSLTKLQEQINKWEFRNIKPLEAQELKARISQSQAMVGYLVAQGRLSVAQAGLVARQTVTEITREYGLHVDNLIKDEDYRNYTINFLNEMDYKKAQTRYMNEQADKTDNDDTRAWVGLVMDGVGQAASFAVPGASGASGAVRAAATASRLQGIHARNAARRAATAAAAPVPSAPRQIPPYKRR